MSRRGPSTAVAALFLCAHAGAQAVIVDPAGGGQFTSLQSAIDAVAPGTTIVVRGGTYSAVRIGKSLRILGEPAPTLVPGNNAQTGSTGNLQEPAIWLQGSGSDELHLANVRTAGRSNGFLFATGASGMAGGGFAAVSIYDSVVRGAPWEHLSGVAQGSPGIELTGSSLRRLVIVRSAVYGGASDADNLYLSSRDGAAGISVASGEVLAIDSAIHGGDGAWLGDRTAPPPAQPCPCANLSGGRGGTGLVAPHAFVTGTTLAGGRGANVFFSSCSPGSCLVEWGRQPDGASFGGASLQNLPSDLSSFQPPHLNAAWDLAWPGGQPAWLILSSLAPAIDLGHLGWLFLDPSTSYLLVSSGSGSARVSIPNDGLLQGLPFAVQLYYVPHGSYPREGLSRPLVEVVR